MSEETPKRRPSRASIFPFRCLDSLQRELKKEAKEKTKGDVSKLLCQILEKRYPNHAEKKPR